MSSDPNVLCKARNGGSSLFARLLKKCNFELGFIAPLNQVLFTIKLWVQKLRLFFYSTGGFLDILPMLLAQRQHDLECLLTLPLICHLCTIF